MSKEQIDMLDALIDKCADAHYECGAWIKGISEEPFQVVLDRALDSGKQLRDYVHSMAGGVQ